jgi:hypothetical protein
MEERFVWMTTRQIQLGTLGDFERAWRPGTHPEGMLRACACWSEDEREIVGISFWASKQACEAWRASAVEARRREVMAAYVVGEQEGFCRGRGLVVPARKRWRRQAATGSPVIRFWLDSWQARGERIILA